MRNRGNFQQQSFRGRNFTRGSQSQYAQSHGRNEKNPLDEHGQHTKCTICESTFIGRLLVPIEEQVQVKCITM